MIRINEAIQFGEDILAAGDLDPVYNAVYAAKLEPEHLDRWLLSYWYFYHMGVASVLSEIRDPVGYWEAFREMLGNAPRGTERRHFRGKAALKTVDYFANSHMSPEMVVLTMQGATFAEVKTRSTVYPLNGPWIAFKIADMLERLKGVQVDFSGCNLEMYKDPVMGAALVMYGDTKAKLQPGDIDAVVGALQDHFMFHPAPPSGDRLINLQEVETILCKYKSHYNGHYPIGKDTKEIREGLELYSPFNETAERLLNATY